MPSRSELPGEIKRRKFIKALRRLGFIVDTSGGDGSHIKITWPKTQKSLTIPSRVRKDVLRYTLKEIESCKGFTLKNSLREFFKRGSLLQC